MPTLLLSEPLMDPLLPTASQIKVVETFVYLGITIHHDISKYVDLNIIPLLIKFKQKATSW